MLRESVDRSFNPAFWSAEVRLEVVCRGEEEPKRLGVAMSIGDVGGAMSKATSGVSQALQVQEVDIDKLINEQARRARNLNKEDGRTTLLDQSSKIVCETKCKTEARTGRLWRVLRSKGIGMYPRNGPSDSSRSVFSCAGPMLVGSWESREFRLHRKPARGKVADSGSA